MFGSVTSGLIASLVYSRPALFIIGLMAGAVIEARNPGTAAYFIVIGQNYLMNAGVPGLDSIMSLVTNPETALQLLLGR